MQSSRYCYQLRTIGTSIPYYYYDDTGIRDWIYDNRYIVIDPPDGLYIDPPASPSFTNTSFSLSRTSLCRTRTLSLFPIASISSLNNSVSEFKINEDEARALDMFISADNDANMSIPVPSHFLKTPYYPSDLFLLMDRQTLVNALKENMVLTNWTKKGLVKKKVLPEKLIFVPGKKTLVGAILKSTSPDISNLSVTLTKACRSFIVHSENAMIIEILNRIDGHPALLPEIAVFLLIETNWVKSTQEIKNAWTLFLIIISRFKFQAVYGKLDMVRALRSYFTIVASSQNTTQDIINNAMLCLFRLSCHECLPFIAYDPSSPLTFSFKCSTPKLLFGVSIGEVLYKERILNFEAQRQTATLVPNIVKRLIMMMKSLNALHTKEIFKKRSSSKTGKLGAIEQLNRGDWEIKIDCVYTIASILKYFFRKLQDPLIPTADAKKLAKNLESYKCIQIANLLPNENEDTLMYLIGFLQEISRFERDTLMNTKRLAEAFASCVIRSFGPNGEIVKDQAMVAATERFLRCLIENWKTDDVYFQD